jgi:hypothetical protein
MVIISSPLGFAGTTVRFEEVAFPQSLEGAISYVGHPSTRALLEALGAETRTGRWEGPAVNESYLAVPLAQNAREGGWTRDVAIESVRELRAIRCTRIA